MEASSNLLSQTSLEHLKEKKNLLAFSAGVDSTALFFLLMKEKISFDIAIVDYNLREQSKQEVFYAKELAKRYDKKIFIKSVELESSNFEKNAREVRYQFFKKIITEYDYNNLLTAHQLNDRLEWFFMQLSKGAGLVEILGYSEIEQRDNFRLIRPLIKCDKESLKAYLNSHKIKYFIDESNFDEKYTRNSIRANFSEKFIQKYKDGVKKSFDYLEEDKKYILKEDSILYKVHDLSVIKRGYSEIRVVDKILKEMGYLLSYAQREEIKRVDELVIGAKFAISKSEKFIFISPYCDDVMPKEFKELCRVLKIPTKIRAYLHKKGINPTYLDATLLDSLFASNI